MGESPPTRGALNVFEHSQPDGGQDPSRQRHWFTPWLRKRTLVLFIVLFAAFVAALIVVWIANKSQNGFRPVLSTNHYAWTYGPTAILVVVLSLWRQIDHHCKLLQPWQAMSKNPVDASRSVLLDYISPINITSFVQAIRNRHAPVAASIAGFAVLKLIILFSTGLLVLSPISETRTFPVTVSSSFDGSSFWATIPRTRDEGPWIFPDREVDGYSNVSSNSLHAYLRLLEEEAPDARNAFDHQAFQHFHLAEDESAQDLSTTVDVFMPNITCEIADATVRSVGQGTYLAAKLDSATCSVGNDYQTELSMFGTPASDCDGDECPPFQPQRDMWRVNCSQVDNSTDYNLLDADNTYDIRYALLVTNMTYEEALSPGTNNTITRSVPHETSAVICKVDYTVNSARVSKSLVNDSYSLDSVGTGQPLANLTGLKLSEIMYAALYNTENIALPEDFEELQSSSVKIPFYYLVSRNLDDQQSIDQLLSPEILQNAAKQVWEGITTQFMQASYMMPAAVESTADGTYIEERLQIGLLSLWAMVAGFILLIIFALIIMFTMPQNLVPQRPSLISTNAAILAASPDLQKLLRNSGHWRMSRLQEHLRGFEFHTAPGDRFEIKATYVGALKGFEAGSPKVKEGLWVPFAARYPIISLTLLSPLVAIIVLEVLYRQSDANGGLVDVSDNEDVASYLSRYLSALIVLLLATNFNALDFTISSLAPFGLLRLGSTPADRSVRFQLLDNMPPVALFQSLRKRHISSAMSNVSGMLGSVLTIISSGLWLIDRSVVTTTPTQASIQSTWAIDWPNSVLNDSEAAVRLDHVQHGSAVMPASIWKDLVLPDIGDIQLSPEQAVTATQGSRSQNFTFDVKALRGELSCEVVSDEHIELEFQENTGGGEFMTIAASVPLPAGCRRGGENGTNDVITFASERQPPGADKLTWMGDFYDLHLGPWDAPDDLIDPPKDFDEDYASVNYQQDNPAGCPSIGILFGGTTEEDTVKDDVTVLLCSQKIQEVGLSVTYEGRDLRQPIINSDVDPVVIEGSARYLTNGTDGVDTFPYRVQQHFRMNLTEINPNDDQQRLDEFMNSLVYGPNGTSLRDLMGVANRDRFIEAVQRLYSKYMSLVIDMHFRQPIAGAEGQDTAALLSDDGDSTTTVSGSALTTTSRLKMNYKSKLTLQIMLGIMIALGLLAFCLTDLRGTLPRNPCSIASTMGFLAGSELCDQSKPLLPYAAEWMSEKQLDKVFAGWLFSLGWWDDSARRESGRSSATEGEQRLLNIGDSTTGLPGRFGIDVGTPEQLGLRETWWWTVRRRMRRMY